MEKCALSQSGSAVALQAARERFDAGVCAAAALKHHLSSSACSITISSSIAEPSQTLCSLLNLIRHFTFPHRAADATAAAAPEATLCTPSNRSPRGSTARPPPPRERQTFSEGPANRANSRVVRVKIFFLFAFFKFLYDVGVCDSPRGTMSWRLDWP